MLIAFVVGLIFTWLILSLKHNKVKAGYDYAQDDVSKLKERLLEFEAIKEAKLLLDNNHAHLYDQCKETNEQKSEIEVQLNKANASIMTMSSGVAAKSSELEGLYEQLKNAKTETSEWKTRYTEKESLLSEGSSNLSEAKSEISKLTMALEKQEKQSTKDIALLKDAEESLAKQFENLANKIFEEKGKTFTTQNQLKLDDVLKPFQEQLRSFEQKVNDVYVDEAKERASLKNEVNKLFGLSSVMSEDAQNLTKALKGDKQKQGAWGELVLERVLESSGLRKGMEYDVQVSSKDSDSRVFRPDAVVRLPDGKDVIIDSKVTLIDYEAFTNAENAVNREVSLKRHIVAVKRHIDGLAEKKYEDLLGVNSLDFILMFMPIESAFILTFQHDQKLCLTAFEKKIIIVTPTTLLATLGTIKNMWTYANQNANAQKIAQDAGNLLDKFRGFAEDLEKLGTQLNNVQDTYYGAMNKLTTGKGNLVKSALKLEALGAKMKKPLPKVILEKSDLNLIE